MDSIKAGSTVYHRPTQKQYLILGVNKNKNEVCIGLPPSIAYLSDCDFVNCGNGITKEELEYRNKTFGYDWD